jgi:hypothetical protein
VGTDDGLVHLTRDGGKNWSNITPKNLPEWSKISLIEASPHDAATAYLAVDRHRFNDFKPYVYKTSDYGKSWSKLTDGIPEGAVVYAVREDPKRKGLLYAGTDLGVFVSWDDGGHWSNALQTNLPVSPIHDLVVKGNDLVVATHGRSFWILDDISPVREFHPQIAQADVHLFKPAIAIRTQAVAPLGEDAPRGPIGQNPPAGAIIYYSLKKSLKKEEPKPAEPTKAAAQQPAQPAPKTEAARSEGAKAEAPKTAAPGAAETKPEEAKEKEAKEQPPDITIEIVDARGTVIRKYPPKEEKREEGDQATGREERKPKPLPADAGVNRFVWDLRYDDAPKVPGAVSWGGGVTGPLVVPGTYQVRLTVQGKRYTAPVEVRPDPRVKTSPQDFAKQFELRMKIHQQITRAHQAVNQMRDVRKQIKDLSGRLDDDARNKNILDAGKELDNKMNAVEEQVIQTKSKAPQDPLNYPIKLNDKLSALGATVESADSAPTKQSYEVFESLRQRLDAQLAKWNALMNGDLAHFNAMVKNQNVPAIIVGAAVQSEEASQGK